MPVAQPSDIATVWNAVTQSGDWALQGSQLQTGSDLATAVVVSLFTNAAAGDDDIIPDGSADPRGWWGDQALGSKLWLLDRAKLTADTIKRLKDYASEALAWLIEDKVASSIDVNAEMNLADGQNRIDLQIVIHRNTSPSTTLSYSWVWGQLS